MSVTATDLENWIKQCGGSVLPSLSLLSELPNGRRRGVTTDADIRRNSVLIKVPDAGCFHCRLGRNSASPRSSGQASLRQEVADWLHRHGRILGSFVCTVALLMAEIALGDRSDLWPWLSNMPKAHDCLLTWSTAEREALAGTPLEGSDCNYRELFQCTVQPLLAKRPDWWTGAHCSFDAFLYAAGMVQSRSFHLNKLNWATKEQTEETDLYMLAGIDMVNHSVHPQQCNAVLDLLPSEPSAHAETSETEARTFVLKAERDIQAGEEVCISYGALSDAQLLRIYGFVSSAEQPSRTNPHNEVCLPLTALRHAYVEYRTMQEQLTELGADEAAAVASQLYTTRVEPVLQTVSLTAALPLPPALLSAALVMLLEDDEYEELLSDSNGSTPHGSCGTPAASTASFPVAVTVEELGVSLAEEPALLHSVCALLLQALITFQGQTKSAFRAAAVAKGTDEASELRQHAAQQVQLGMLDVLKAAIVQLLEVEATVEGEDGLSDSPEGTSSGSEDQ